MFRFLTALCLTLTFTAAHALPVVYTSADIRIKGKLVPPPPCKVNNDEEILVDFKRVSMKGLEKGDIRQEVEIPFECQQDSNDFKYFLTVDGPRAQFNNKLIKTDMTNLAFNYELEGVVLDLGKATLVNTRQMKMTVVLKKNPDGTLAPGSFTGSGTVTMEYF